MDYTAQEPFDRLPMAGRKCRTTWWKGLVNSHLRKSGPFFNKKGSTISMLTGSDLTSRKEHGRRAFTVQFMPLRPDVKTLPSLRQSRGVPRLTNQTAIDMLQPGDVLVVDLFAKK